MNQVGRFEVRAQVGRGAAGVVLRAYDPDLKREVALKLLAPERLADPTSRARFQREATAASRLKHPHVAAVYEMGEEAGQPYLVMEWIDGQTLQEHLKARGRLPLAEALQILDQLAQGLDAAHALGVVHRDVKTANIMLGPNNHATLVDFGLATTLSTPSVTETGVVLGTPLYMAPEQIQGGQVDGRADLYSLAVVFFEMLAGESPFHERTIAAVFHRHLHEPPPRLSERVPSLDPRLDGVLARALAKKPEQRYPHGRDLVLALQAPERAAPPLIGRRPVVLVLGAAALVGLAGAAAHFAPRPARVELWKQSCPTLAGMAGNRDLLALTSANGLLLICRPQTGEVVWQTRLSGPAVGPPLLAPEQGLVLAASESRVTAYQSSTGKALWHLEEEEISGLWLAEGTLYVTAWEEVATFDLEGQELERRSLPGTQALLPAVLGQGSLFVVSELGPVLALALESDGLETAWKASLTEPQSAILEASQGMLVVASTDGVTALAGARGTELWAFPAPSLPVGLAAGQGLVVVTCEDGQVAALELDGSVRWQVRPASELEAAPLVTASAVLVPGPRGLHQLDVQGGQELQLLECPGAYLAPLTLEDRFLLAGRGTLAAYPLTRLPEGKSHGRS